MPATAVTAGTNYFHIASVNAMSAVGTVEQTIKVVINSAPPTVASTSHPVQTAWSANTNAFFQWTLPVGDDSAKGVFYALDAYGDTVPTAANTFLPVTQKQLLRSGLAPGIWVLHVVAQDQKGYLTKSADHYRVMIGNDPGTGSALGRVSGPGGTNIAGATVTVNRGLYTQTTNATGNYNFVSLPAGTWEMRAVKPPSAPVTKTVVIAPGASTPQDFTLP
jgi:hypothetical protein